MQTKEQILKEMGLLLPEGKPLRFPFLLSASRLGNAIFTSGAVSIDQQQGKPYVGKVGVQVDTKYAKQAARVAILNCLSALQKEAGSLDNVKRIVKVLGFVNSSEEFTQQAEVINAASEGPRGSLGRKWEAFAVGDRRGAASEGCDG